MEVFDAFLENLNFMRKVKHIKLSLLFRALMHCISSRLIMHRQELNGMQGKNDSFNFLNKQIRDMFLQDYVLGQLELVFRDSKILEDHLLLSETRTTLDLENSLK